MGWFRGFDDENSGLERFMNEPDNGDTPQENLSE